jgi:RNA polymerase sigma-70 factor (ECF subfamily)
VRERPGEPFSDAPLVALSGLTPMVRAAQRGESDALEQLVGALTEPLLRASRALLGSGHPDIDDLTQDVLLDVLDALPSFRGESTLLHFAIRIAARKATTLRRRTRSVAGFVERWWRGVEPLQAIPESPREEAIAARRRDVFARVLRDVPGAQAETMLLRIVFGYSIEEVAQLTCTPINTVRSRLRLGKDALRRRLEADPRGRELSEVEA